MTKTNETIIKQVKLDFYHLPDYANFLLYNKPDEFSLAMLNVSLEEKLPILKHFETLPEDQVIKLTLESTKVLLKYFAENKANEYIDFSQKRWVNDQLPLLLQGESIIVRDITKLSFIRRKVFRRFISDYTTDITTHNNIMEEVDRFTTYQEESNFEILMDFSRQKINGHHHFIEKINNTTPGIIYVFDLMEQKEVYSNHKKEQLLGFTENDFKEMGNNILTFLIHPKDLTKIKEHYSDFSFANDGEVRTIQNRIRTKKGRYRWFHEYATVFKRTAEGIPSQIICIAIDITKEKEAILELKHRDKQLSEAQEIAGLGTFEWNLLGGNSSFSPQLMKIFDLESESNLLSFMEGIHPSDRKILKNAIDNSIKSNGYYECQYRYKKKKHSKMIWSRGLVSFEEGKPSKIKGFVMDVTRSYLLNQQLEENESTFRQLIQNAPDAVIVIDNSSKILLWNPKAEAIFGWKVDEIIGKTLMETIIPAQFSASHTHGINRLKLTGQSNLLNKTVEITAVNKDGTEFFIALSIASSLWNGKQVFISFIRNITKEKKIEKELEQGRKQLAQKNKELEKINNELTSFSYVASHDLKGPLRKIKTYSNLLIEKHNETLTTEGKEYIQRIISSAGNMQQLIDDLLSFSHTASAEKKLETLDLNILLEEVENSLKDTIEENNVTITSTQLPTLSVIDFQFRQLLENIISNAIKYSKVGVKPIITITSSLVSGKSYVNDGADANKNYQRFLFADNGIGFEQEYATKIFEIFQRLHGKNEYSGTGIGLAICKKIMENHKGFITAQSTVGQGSIFNAFFPVKIMKNKFATNQ